MLALRLPWPPPNQSARVFVGATCAQTGLRRQRFKAKTSLDIV